MKLNAGKRILMFFHWLFSLLAFAAFTAWIIKPEWTQGVVNGVAGGLSATQKTVIGITLLAVYVLLTVMQAFIIFHRDKRTDRGFITVDSSDSGRVRIAVSAVRAWLDAHASDMAVVFNVFLEQDERIYRNLLGCA